MTNEPVVELCNTENESTVFTMMKNTHWSSASGISNWFYKSLPEYTCDWSCTTAGTRFVTESN